MDLSNAKIVIAEDGRVFSRMSKDEPFVQLGGTIPIGAGELGRIAEVVNLTVVQELPAPTKREKFLTQLGTKEFFWYKDRASWRLGRFIRKDGNISSVRIHPAGYFYNDSCAETLDEFLLTDREVCPI